MIPQHEKQFLLTRNVGKILELLIRLTYQPGTIHVVVAVEIDVTLRDVHARMKIATLVRRYLGRLSQRAAFQTSRATNVDVTFSGRHDVVVVVVVVPRADDDVVVDVFASLDDVDLVSNRFSALHRKKKLNCVSCHSVYLHE